MAVHILAGDLDLDGINPSAELPLPRGFDRGGLNVKAKRVNDNSLKA